MTAGGLTLFALGIYSARTTTGLAGKYLEARLGKPSLIRDTSRFTVLDTIKHPIKTFQRFRNKAEDSLQGVVLEVSIAVICILLSYRVSSFLLILAEA